MSVPASAPTPNSAINPYQNRFGPAIFNPKGLRIPVAGMSILPQTGIVQMPRRLDRASWNPLANV